MFKVTCAWCDRVLRDGILPISHGICPECKTKAMEEISTKIGETAEGRALLRLAKNKETERGSYQP